MLTAIRQEFVLKQSKPAVPHISVSLLHHQKTLYLTKREEGFLMAQHYLRYGAVPQKRD